LVAAGFCASQEPNQQLCCASSARSNTPAAADFTSSTCGCVPCTRISSRTTDSATGPEGVVSSCCPTAVHGTRVTSSQVP